MKVYLSGTLLQFTNYQKSFDLQADTVETALRSLIEECPRLAPVIFEPSGALRRVHRVFLNSEQLSEGDLARSLGMNDELEIVTAVAGG